MSKKALYVIIGIVVIIIIFVAIKGSSILPERKRLPDNLAISDELGGSKPSTTPAPTGAVKGSCYIKADSQCMDYLGSAFSPDRIKMVCSNKGAVISTSVCPATAKVGGCHAMIGTEMEMISWVYSNGDKPVDANLLEMNKTICNGMSKSEWVGVK